MDAAFSVLLLLLPVCWLAGFAVGRMDHASGRYRRRGGELRPPASPGPSQGTWFINGATPGLEVSFSSSTQPGGASAARVTPPTLVLLSRPIGPGLSTDVMGTVGKSGRRLRAAGSDEVAS